MTSNASTKSQTWKGFVVITVLLLAAFGLVIWNVDWSSPTIASETVQQRAFRSPAEAGTALDNAANNNDQAALAQILGLHMKSLLTTGDAAADGTAISTFASKYQQMNRWVDMSDGSRVLYIGADNFAFPVPLAKNPDGQWYFDAVAGADEVRARNIGRNELLAIDACVAFANAQQLYFESSDPQQYAQRIISTPGKQDGLYWPVHESQGSSPLGHLSKVPKTSLAAYSADKPFVIDGYSLRILTAQGADVDGGAMNYIVDGKMTTGFAILATPVKYAETGIMSFMISQEDVVYERDFGPDTAKLTAAIQAYNPDDNWSPVTAD
jgi:Protein of unknown function (DUF2950)